MYLHLPLAGSALASVLFEFWALRQQDSNAALTSCATNTHGLTNLSLCAQRPADGLKLLWT